MTDSDRIPGTGRQSDPLAAFPRAPVQGGGDSRDHLADVVLERIVGRLGDDREPAPEAPSVEQAITLRDQAPELYDLWLKIAQEKASTANYVDRAPYEVPERLAQSGRPRALGALIVVLSFCGYLAWLGGPGPYIGGLVAILDLVAMLGVFFGLRPDRLAEPRRPGHKPLAPAFLTGLSGGHTRRALIVIKSSCLYGEMARSHEGQRNIAPRDANGQGTAVTARPYSWPPAKRFCRPAGTTGPVPGEPCASPGR